MRGCRGDWSVADVPALIFLVVVVIVFSLVFTGLVEERGLKVVGEVRGLDAERSVVGLLRAPFDEGLSVADALVLVCAGRVKVEDVVNVTGLFVLPGRLRVKVACREGEEVMIREDPCEPGGSYLPVPGCSGVGGFSEFPSSSFYVVGPRCSEFREVVLPSLEGGVVKVLYCGVGGG